MKAFLNRFMSRLGYVPRAEPTSIGSLTFDISVNSASMDAAKKTLDELVVSAAKVEEAMKNLLAAEGAASTAMLRAGFLMPSVEKFATAELGADPATIELLNQVRALIEEIRQDRRDNLRIPHNVVGQHAKNWIDRATADGANNSGLPG